MKGFTWFILIISCLQLHAQTPVQSIFMQKFTPVQLQEDFSLFRMSMEKIHPALYRYATRTEMDSIFDRAWKRLDRSMTYEDFYKLVAIVNSHIRCQHTAIGPAKKDLKQIDTYAKMFPYEISWDFDPLKAYVYSDLTNEGGIKPVTEIVKINGQPVQAVYDTLIKYLFADGYNLTSKRVRLVPFDFQHWFYFFIGRPDTFEIDFLVNGLAFTKRVSALTMNEYVMNARQYIRSKDPDIKRLIDHYIPKQQSKSYRLEFLKGPTALLTLKDFGPLEFMHQSFKKIKDKGTTNLIIDVRQNRGGWDDRGYTLFSYLIKKPARYYDSIFTTITDIDFLLKHTDKDSGWLKENEYLWWEDSKPLLNSLSEGLSLIQPQQNRFDGNVYILMDGKSMSTTAEFTAAAHYNKLATFIGEESGGAYEGGNGADFATVTLPNTGLTINVPLAKYVMATFPKIKGRGTIPDYEIKTTAKDFLELRDPVLEFALDLINKGK